jgi:SAM-dependent methyltransferase
MKDELINELKKISKGQWFGLPYGSYHHPEFTLAGSTFGQNPVCQRDTKERFEMVGLTEKELKGKTILDIGCNTGSMLLYAKQLGASNFIGIDNHAPNITFCCNLFRELNIHNYSFMIDDANKDLFIPEDVNVIFCLAISKWVDYDHLIKLLSESGAELIWFEDNKHMGKVIPDIIPGYDCEFKFASGPEANTPTGWGRMNYLCRGKK